MGEASISQTDWVQIDLTPDVDEESHGLLGGKFQCYMLDILYDSSKRC